MSLEQADELGGGIAPDVAAFAASWVEAWNSLDLARISAHYSSDVEFHSPVVARLVPGSDGVVRGRDRLVEYFAQALDRNRDLHFEHLACLQGVMGGVAILYRNHRGVLVIETVRVEGGKITWAHVYYSKTIG